MPQQFKSAIRTYKYPFELVMAVSKILITLLWETIPIVYEKLVFPKQIKSIIFTASVHSYKSHQLTTIIVLHKLICVLGYRRVTLFQLKVIIRSIKIDVVLIFH